jgi:hypothetical protein
MAAGECQTGNKNDYDNVSLLKKNENEKV